jgi:hypothetical protein
MIFKRESLIRDPEVAFGDPNQLARRTDLSHEEKLDVLESWRLDLLELQRASEENMSSADSGAGSVAEKLRQVSEALDAIRRESHR